MTVEVRLRKEAESDLAIAALWYEEQRVGLGHEFLGNALDTLQGIRVAGNSAASMALA
jgi:hypothetical protein